MEESGQLHGLTALHPREKASVTHWIGDLAGPKAGLDSAEEKNLLSLTEIEPWFLGRPSRCLVTILTVLSRLILVHTGWVRTVTDAAKFTT
jgi:hypothetical protein